ncbi:MAG: hypothetical protein EOO01_26180 [Chitinophagaceae bacterium]|nr:MAG: hypothetical protein EOO01_26180 [Chitinophagaceae bacterium]
MNFTSSEQLSAVKRIVISYYHMPTKYVVVPLPASAYYRPRARYRADGLINYLSKLRGNYRFAVGLTSKDISTTKGSIPDYGIFGLGTLNNTGCVVSTFRLSKRASPALVIERLQKVVLHEIGHNYGLAHCTSSEPCFMKDALGKISTVDQEPMNMCASCRKSARF